MKELEPAELFPPPPLTMFLDDDSDADREILDEKKQNKTFKANMKKAGGLFLLSKRFQRVGWGWAETSVGQPHFNRMIQIEIRLPNEISMEMRLSFSLRGARCKFFF